MSTPQIHSAAPGLTLTLPTAVQRGFATTSLPTKKAKEEAAAAKAEKEAAVQEQEASKTAADESNASPIAVVSSSNANDAAPAPAGAKDAWDDDHAIETAVYQALVDRLQEKGEKEVTRVIKVSTRRHARLTSRSLSSTRSDSLPLSPDWKSTRRSEMKHFCTPCRTMKTPREPQ